MLRHAHGMPTARFQRAVGSVANTGTAFKQVEPGSTHKRADAKPERNGAAPKDQGKTRIELTVDIENKPAIKLYEKIGFVIEGRVRNSYKRFPENRYLDEYLMGLIL